VGFGSLPGVGPGFGFDIGTFARRFRVAVDARYWTARTQDVLDASVVFRMWSLGALAGPRFELPRNFELAPLAGVEAGQVITRGRSLDAADDPSDPWVAARLRLQAAWQPIRWLAPTLGFEMTVPLRRTRFSVEGAGVVHQATSVGVRGVLGLEARFP
jgi:hypothetical protein